MDWISFVFGTKCDACGVRSRKLVFADLGDERICRKCSQEREDRRHKELDELQRQTERFTYNPEWDEAELLCRLIEACEAAGCKTSSIPEHVQEAARKLIKAAGPNVHGPLRELLGKCEPESDFDNNDMVNKFLNRDFENPFFFTLRLLMMIGDEEDSGLIVRHFGAYSSSNLSLRDEIIKFLVKFRSLDSANGLVEFLGHDYGIVRHDAARGLGLLGFEETRDAIKTALKEDAERSQRNWIWDGLSNADTEFAKDVMYN